MLPEAFAERMQRMLGEEYGTFLESFEEERAQALCLNPRKRNLEGHGVAEHYGIGEGGETFDTVFGHLTKVLWAKNGYYYMTPDQPGKHPCHEAGLYYIQEPSAMAPVELLDVQPGERILDLCAAPGGKSAQIAAALRGEGFLVSNEIHPARVKILAENMERMGAGNVCVTNETPEHLAGFFTEYFDKILVDAPCSGEGMFRKNETACGEWSPENVELCAQRQGEILDRAAEMLRPGGKLVYSTCTFAPLENEGSISRFLKRHREFAIVPVKKEKLGLAGCDGMPDYIEEPVSGLGYTLRLWPQRVRGEGHFAALLQKAGSMPERDRGSGSFGTGGAGCKSISEELVSFCNENIILPVLRSGEREDAEILQELAAAVGMGRDCRCIQFGDNIYLVPADLPSLRGMKVLRPGLHLGERKKNRFEPSHALAMALCPENAIHVWNLNSEETLASAYLNGQTFPAEGEKGWYLICVDGFGLGWGKLAGGIMKNHYPRGLRRNFC